MKMENYIKHILTIEDNREFWETLAELFRPDPSYQFTFVDDGNEGCNLLISKPFDLAIIDLGLPGKPGREIVNDAKFAGVKTPMLVLTANEDERSESDNMNDGAVDYVRKSSAHHVIVSRIKAAIRNSTSDDRPVIPFGKCAYDTTCDTIIGPKPKQCFDLPPKPARVLETLMRSKSHGMRAIPHRRGLEVRRQGQGAHTQPERQPGQRDLRGSRAPPHHPLRPRKGVL